MTLQRFVELLDRRGADLEGWPAEERASAEKLLAQSAEARDALEEARALDGALAGLEAAEPRSELRAQILAVPERHPRLDAWWPFATVYRPMLAMAAAALMGIGVGNWVFASTASGTSSQTELSERDFEELSALAFAEESGSVWLDPALFDTSNAALGTTP